MPASEGRDVEHWSLSHRSISPATKWRAATTVGSSRPDGALNASSEDSDAIQNSSCTSTCRAHCRRSESLKLATGADTSRAKISALQELRQSHHAEDPMIPLALELMGWEPWFIEGVLMVSTLVLMAQGILLPDL